MNFIVHDVEQRSEAWAALRLGRLCGSRAADMLATVKTKGAEAAGRRNLRAQLVLERLTNRSQEKGFVSDAMRDGILREGDALAMYEAVSGNLVQPVGFVSHVSLMAGASPDGVVGEWEGLVEAKSPIPATHLDYLKTGVIPGEYMKQIVHGLWLTGAKWCDWFSYNPDFPEPLQMKLVRVDAADVDLAAYEELVKLFLAEVDAEVKALGAMAGAAA